QLSERFVRALERRTARARRSRHVGGRRGHLATRGGKGIRQMDGGKVPDVSSPPPRRGAGGRPPGRQCRAAAVPAEETPRSEAAHETRRTVATISVSGVLVPLAEPANGNLIRTVLSSWFFVLGSWFWVHRSSPSEPGTSNHRGF